MRAVLIAGALVASLLTGACRVRAADLNEEFQRRLDEAQQLLTRAQEKLSAFQKSRSPMQREEARRLFASAASQAAKTREELREMLSGFGRPVGTGPDVREEYLRIRLLGPTILEWSAEAYSGDERRDLLEQASREFKDCYEAYRTRMVGLDAGVNHGRCQAKLGQFDEALGIYEPILDLPNSPKPLFELKAKAYALAADVWCDPGRWQYDTAIERLQAFLAHAPDGKPTAFRLLVRLQLARAHKLQGDELRKANPEDADAAEHYRLAAEHAQAVSEYDSEHTKAAKALLQQLGAADDE